LDELRLQNLLYEEMSVTMKKGAVEVMDQGVHEVSEAGFAAANEQVSGEDKQESGIVAVDRVTLENQVIDPESLNKELQDEEQITLEPPAAPAPKKRERTRRQAVMPEGYTLEAGVWERIFQSMKRGYTVAAQVVAIDYPDGRPAWELTFRDYTGIKGVVPAGETDLSDPRLMQWFVGQPINVKIRGLDRENNLVACSRREAVTEARTRLFDEVQEGDVLECIVKAILPRNEAEKKPERLLVDVGGGVLAGVNRSRAALKLSQRLSHQYNPGQAVTARVTRIEPQQGIIEVSLKDGDAWNKAYYKRGQPISGTIVAINGDTCFIEPDASPGVLGIAPLPFWGEFRRRTRVSCKVVNFRGDAHKLRLYILTQLA
jgi:small subunit ribosomal protein S1